MDISGGSLLLPRSCLDVRPPNVVFSLLPFFNFGKIFLDITTFTTGKPSPITGTFSAGSSMPFSAIYSSIPDTLLPIYGDGEIPNVPSPVMSLYYLIGNIALYGLLTWYLDKVLPNEFGYRHPPLFFLTSEFWGGNTYKPNHQDWHLAATKRSPVKPSGRSADVVNEEILSLSQSNLSINYSYRISC